MSVRTAPESPPVAGGSRAAWADTCRVVSIYGVVLIHSSGPVFYTFGSAPMADWLAANALDSLARVSVPLFAMLSGALLLKPGLGPVPLQRVISRIGKVAVPLLAWSALYLYLVAYHTGQPVSWLGVFSKPAMYHLWFVYMIIGIYLILPFLQAIFNEIRASRTLTYYFVVIWALVTCLPVHMPVPLLGVMQLTSFLGYGGYFILGGLLASSERLRVPTSVLVGTYIVCSMVTFLLTWHFSDKAGAASEAAYVYFSANVALASLAAFKAFTRVRMGFALARVMNWLSDRSFVIFFVHVLVLEQVRHSSAVVALSQSAPALVTIFLTSIVTFALSLLVAALIRLVPGANRLAG